MSRALLVYFSLSGNTHKVAEKIASGLRQGGYAVDLFNIKDEQAPDVYKYDLLGIGTPVYYFRPCTVISSYVRGLSDLNGYPVFTFLSYGTFLAQADTELQEMLAKKGADNLGTFLCRGENRFIPYLEEGYLFSKDHPNAEELARAENFGGKIAVGPSNRIYCRSKKRETLTTTYRFERHWMTPFWIRHVHSRMFRINYQQCSACGDCISLCPVGNISKNAEGKPVWGRHCLLCLNCQAVCPEGAIRSVADNFLARSFIHYNIRKAVNDPLIDYERINIEEIKALCARPEKALNSDG